MSDPLLGVLIVDDMEEQQTSIQRAVHAILPEAKVATVSSGPLAMDLLWDASYDIVLVDYRMPGMPGTDLLAQIKRSHPTVKRILMSAHFDQVQPPDLESFSEVADSVIWKPFELEELKIAMVGPEALD